MKYFILFTTSVVSLFAKISIELPYGLLEIDDPCIEEIAESDPFLRLKQIHQYGISFYNHTFENYSRYEHCLGVYMLLNKVKAPYHEQISGLLHDASHTAFSHFGDYYFNSHGEDAWQDLNHNQFLEKIGLVPTITKYGIKIDEIYHKNKSFTALDQPLPDLCADRLEYNLQGAYKHGLLTQEELKILYDDVTFQEGKWSFSDVDLALKLSRASIEMTETMWSSPIGHVSNMVLAKIASHAVKNNLLTEDEICLESDLYVMKKLQDSQDTYILKGLELIMKMAEVVQEGTQYHYGYKCRAINPLMRTPEGLKRLTELSAIFKEEFQKAKEKAKTGMTFLISEKNFENYKNYLDDLIALES